MHARVCVHAYRYAYWCVLCACVPHDMWDVAHISIHIHIDTIQRLLSVPHKLWCLIEFSDWENCLWCVVVSEPYPYGIWLRWNLMFSWLFNMWDFVHEDVLSLVYLSTNKYLLRCDYISIASFVHDGTVSLYEICLYVRTHLVILIWLCLQGGRASALWSRL